MNHNFHFQERDMKPFNITIIITGLVSLTLVGILILKVFSL